MTAFNTSKRYSYREVLQKSLRYFSNDELAASSWINKYAIQDGKGKYLEASPDDMHWRMAREFSRIEKKYAARGNKRTFKQLSPYGQRRKFLNVTRIFELFKDFSYIIPQGSVMSGLKNPTLIASLSNCVVLPEIYDSYGGILYTDQQLAQLFKRRCGVGIDISSLRPEGMSVSNAANSTSGAASFMHRFSNTTREVAQSGRRGALMITMDIAHPDIEAFINMKQDLSKVTGANVSVRISDEFMNAVRANGSFLLRWPVDAAKPEIKKKIKARDLWNKIIHCAHHTAEPGIIFWDRQHIYSTSSVYPGFKNLSTNPCSEIAMQGGDSCRLIALNLFSFVDHPFTPRATFNYGKFYEVTYEAQRLMDDLVDLELEAIERIIKKIASDNEPPYIKDVEQRTWKLLYETGKKGRRTGLGFTALADVIAALGVKFDSDASLHHIEQIMKTKCRAEFDSSIDMAIERGAFEAFDEKTERKSAFVHMLKKELPEVYLRMMKHGRRNISISTVAPTGTLSILAQTSSGLEPVYQLAYKRRRKVNANDIHARVDFIDALGDAWQEFIVHHPKLKRWMDITGEKDIEKSPYHGSTASEIDWVKRIEIQARVQKYVTHSISSTINLPAEVSVETVGKIYIEAWKRGLKGITIYRDGSRSGVLVNAENKTSRMSTAMDIIETQAPERPAVLEAQVLRFLNNDEKWIAVVGLLNGKPYEIFTGKAGESFVIPETTVAGWVVKSKINGQKSQYDFQYLNEAGLPVTVQGLSRSFNKEYWNYAKLISGVLRHGMPLPHVVELVSDLNLYSDHINTWKNGVERALKRFIPSGTPAIDRICTVCGDPEGLIHEEGCIKCKSCGHSQCG